jgi:prepilin-type N-terminal cleavage/methylation domain-containing protein
VESGDVMNVNKNNHGVTLVEMLIVVTIIAILATVSLIAISSIEDKSKENTVKETLTLLDSALREYYEYTGTFPAQPQMDFVDPNLHIENMYTALDSLPDSRFILQQIDAALVQNRDLKNPKPEIYDPWGTPLDYICCVPDDNFPRLRSAGKDKIFGSGDDITNMDI